MKEEKEFSKDLWSKFTSYRKKIARTIIRKNCLIGKSKSEVIELFGKEDNYYELDEWSYFLKKNFLGGETFLLIHFKGEFVKKQQMVTIFSWGTEPLLTI